MLVAPQVIRCTIEGTYLGAPMANVIDVVMMLTPDNRQDGCVEAAQAVLKAWHEEILPVMHGQYIADRVRFVDLDSPTGPTGEVTQSGAISWPYPGNLGGLPYSGAIATLVTKASSQTARGTRSGRMFLPPPGEADVAGNTIDPAYLAALNVALGDFLENLLDDDPVAVAMVVPHVIAGEYVGRSGVGQLSARSRVSTQRRRNR